MGSRARAESVARQIPNALRIREVLEEVASPLAEPGVGSGNDPPKMSELPKREVGSGAGAGL